MTKTKSGHSAGSSYSKRSQAASACQACRSSKLKCSGRHPTCARCNSRGIECKWLVREGLTVRQHISHELKEQQRDLGHALNVLDVLRNGSDAEAAETLVCLRLGQTVEQASEGSASARARRQDSGATVDDLPVVAGSSQKSGTDSQRHDSHFGEGCTTTASDAAGSPNTLQNSRSTTAALPRPSHAESKEQRPQVSAFDTQLASWSFPNTPETPFSSTDWNNVAMQQAEQSDFLMDGIFAQYEFAGGDGDNNVPNLWYNHVVSDI